MNAIQFPLTQITIGFIFGILFAHYSNINPLWTLVMLGISTSLLITAFYWSKKQLFQNIFFGITAYFLSFCIGIASLVLHSGSNQKQNYIHRIDSAEKHHVVEIVLREKLKPTAYYSRYIALVNSIDGKSCSGKLLVNFNKDQFQDDFRIGTQLQVNNTIVLHRQPLNPDQFDYGKYLKNKSVLAQTYVDNSNVKANKTIVKDAFYYSDVLRSTILGNLKKKHFHDAELNVLAALILGQQQEINAEIVQDYQFAGAVHILSVSGLHVGFIVLFLNFLLGFLPHKKWISYFKLTVIIVCLWGFAVIAGLSPSVVRSVTMFSFVAVGMHLKRKTNIFHTLLVSLFLILLFEPSFMFDIGFQLSYLALFFIVWMQPLFYEIGLPQNKIANYFWQILTVSLAAQIGTLPLSLYYFHQFSGLFFLTNIVVIPMLSIIMALGVSLMLLAATGFVPAFLASLTEWSIFILNKIIGKIASFEQFVLKDIPFNGWMLLTLYIVIIAFVYGFKKVSFRRIAFVLIAILLFQTAYFSARWRIQNQQEWIVFNIKKSTLIAERIGENVTLYSDTDHTKNKLLSTFLTANFCRIDAQKPITNLAVFQNKKIAIIDKNGSYPRNVSPDIMLLRQSPKINLDRVFKTCKPKMLIVDASNYKSYVARWKSTCLKEKIPFHNTNEKGFYKLEE